MFLLLGFLSDLHAAHSGVNCSCGELYIYFVSGMIGFVLVFVTNQIQILL